ncbi:MAG: hypothetical protein CBB65_08920 [Hyphomonadaceae bacterium TMED5]|nr:hypothetical protein [Ponticaulis sp.]OUY00238.1 MAG: hypothetical protein CBB65_08920 [Hyphomonadaceae bacterium TMED5]|tara:strand:- start:175887 stop:176201 length:315 start_codon:yes stop_codon:yes gene_type:complete
MKGMTVQLIYRKAHDRKLKSGAYTRIPGSWMIRESAITTHESKTWLHDCPMCGAKIRSAKMPNGGWAHYEALGGLQSLKHPCFYVGEDVRNGRDEKTLDLFDAL